jgi:hypothetical protein
MEIGSNVTLRGLQNRKELNGSRGVIVGFLKDGRLGVRLIQTTQSISVHADNLQLTSEISHGVECSGVRHMFPRLPATAANLQCSIVILVHSTIRDRVVSFLRAKSVPASTAGEYGVEILCDFRSDLCNFFPGLSKTEGKYCAAALLGVESKDVPETATVPYDMQSFLPCNHSAVRVVYGQESQAIYYKVAGPEPLPCKFGPSKGGALVLFRASFSMDECVCGEMADEYYKMHPLGISHNDLVTEAARLLAKAEIPY